MHPAKSTAPTLAAPTTHGQRVSPLVIRFGAFGDMVLIIPALKLLSQRHGSPCDVVSSGPWTRPLLERVPAVGELRFLTSRRTPYWFNRSQWEFVAWLKQRPPGPVYVFESDEKSLSLLRRAGVKSEWICTLRDYPRLPGEHILAHAMRLARATPRALKTTADAAVDSAATPSTRPVLTGQDRRDCAEWIEGHHAMGVPLVLIQPGNKKTMKGGDRRRSSNVDYWSEENWASVITGVYESLPTARIIICGAPAELPIAEDIASLLPVRQPTVIIAANELPLPRLLALQERAHSMVSVNTGPAHSAAAMGCPLLVMFTRHAHRAADLYAPVPTTAPVKIIQPELADADAGLSAITPNTVVAAWRELVSG